MSGHLTTPDDVMIVMNQEGRRPKPAVINGIAFRGRHFDSIFVYYARVLPDWHYARRGVDKAGICA